MTDFPKPLTRYRHYKGGVYEVIGIGQHSETEEKLVIYQSVVGRRLLWARPLDMWMKAVDDSPRFSEIEDDL